MTGSGTFYDPYLVYTLSDLNSINDYFPLSTTTWFKQMADIEIGTNFTPIGYGNDFNAGGKLYYNGNYFKLKNGTVDKSGDNYIGVFSACGGIYRVNVNNVQVTGNQYVGGIVGRLGNIMYCCNNDSSSTVSGYTICGGLVGSAISNVILDHGSITYCSNSADVNVTFRGNDWNQGAGGISGEIGAYDTFDLSNCCNTSTITSLNYKDYVGGIVGTIRVNNMDISNCHNTGDINAGYYRGCGSIIGQNIYLNNKSMQHCFGLNSNMTIAYPSVYSKFGRLMSYEPVTVDFLSNNYGLDNMSLTVDGISESFDFKTSDGISGEDITAAEAKSRQTYIDNGWDMTNIWDIDEGNGFPFLRIFNRQFDFGRYVDTPYNNYVDIKIKNNKSSSWIQTPVKKYNGSSWITL